MSDARAYPQRPFLAVSAAIVRDGKILVVRRARMPAHGLYTLPGGVVEVGETLVEAVAREVLEETGMTVEPVALAGFREAVTRDAQDRVERHFVILCFAARWQAGEPPCCQVSLGSSTVLLSEVGPRSWQWRASGR